MFYLSRVQNQRIWDAYGRPVGRCRDLLVGPVDEAFPRLVAIAVKDGDKAPAHIAIEHVSSLYPSIVLSLPLEQLRAYTLTGDELPLAERVMDRQIVDTEGRRVVRVNDVQLARIRERFRVTGVDVGGLGLLRRLGIESGVGALARVLGKALPERVIPWEDVASIHQDDPLRLRISRDRISQLPPADIAAILDDLDRVTSEALLNQLDNEVLADALAESPADVQASVLLHMDPERAADVLEEMDPDEAADVLADLPEENSAQLLDLMEDANAEEVSSLLAYPENAAGGIMTTEFARVPVGLSAAEALDYLRRSVDALEDEAMHYVYVLDEADHLQHVMKLRDLVMAAPSARLEDIAEPADARVTVNPFTAQQDVAYLVAKYDLLAVPVVDDETQKMLGIVTVDDAIDAVLPTAWKKRLPRFS